MKEIEMRDSCIMFPPRFWYISNFLITPSTHTCVLKVDLSATLAELSGIFDKDHFVLVVKTQQCYTGVDQVKEKSVVVGKFLEERHRGKLSLIT